MNYIYNISYNNYILSIIILIFIFYIITKDNIKDNDNRTLKSNIEKFAIPNCTDQTNCLLDYKGVPISNNTYTLLGAFKDSSPYNKTIPLFVSNSPSINNESLLRNAINIANSYGAPVFGLQDNGSLYLGYDINRAISIGQVTCSKFGGCNCVNQVYVAATNYTYTLLGAYTDNDSRMIPIKIPLPFPSPYSDITFGSSDQSVLSAAVYIANLYGATVFGFQNKEALFIGYDVNKATSLGKVTCTPTLGCLLVNKVYVATVDTSCS